MCKCKAAAAVVALVLTSAVAFKCVTGECPLGWFHHHVLGEHHAAPAEPGRS